MSDKEILCQDDEIYVVTDELAGERLDKLVSVVADMSRTLAAKMIDDGKVLVDGKVEDKKYKLKVGQTVSVSIPEPEPMGIEAENITLDIVYEDEDIIVVNKPSGMVVHKDILSALIFNGVK